MLLGITYTTDMRDPQVRVQRLYKLADAREFMRTRNDVLAWPGSGNYHKRLARVVEVKNFRLRAAEQRVLDKCMFDRMLGRYDHDDIRTAHKLMDRAEQVALRIVGADADADTWGRGAYTIRRFDDDALDIHSVTVQRPDNAALHFDTRSEMFSFTAADGTKHLLWTFEHAQLQPDRDPIDLLQEADRIVAAQRCGAS